MASAARGESSNPYGGGLGTGGKFRKQTTRKSQKTPYDRPPTSVRNPGLVGGEGRRGSWLSKCVDLTQRLITYKAHMLFASVFRKRLGSGETPLQSPEQLKQRPERDVNQEMKTGEKEDFSNLSEKKDSFRIKDTNVSVDPTKDGFIDLEKILKEKTFTRSEVDRLTTLLRSKAADSSTVNEEQRNEVSIGVRHPPSHERDTKHPDNGSMNALVSTPPGSLNAFNECIASPAQLAKAYMGNRPSEVTPSMLGLRGQAVREDSVFLNRTPYLPKSPTMPLVPKPFGQRPVENGFVTPRSRGKSALYSMARTPYSRPQSTVKIGSLFQASPNTWEESLSSGLRQGYQTSLKRRSSVLDNDIGSVGPVRRIRQKSNLSSRSLALPASESPLSVRANGGQNITHTSKDNTEDISGSSFNLVPTKSSEIASKILQQLDKLVSTREKSPSKLSPSMLRGPALNSLQNVEAPNFLDNVPENKENSPGSSYQMQEKSKESGFREVLALSGKTGGVEGSSKPACSKDQEAHVKGDYFPLMSSLEEHPQKKRAFRMSAHEDFLELDEDHGAASNPFEVAEKQNAFKVEQDRINVPKGEKPLTLSEAIPSTTHISNGDASQGTSNGPLETGRSKFAAVPIEAVQQRNVASEPTSKFIQVPEKSAISPGRLISEEKGNPVEEPKKAVAVFPNIFSSPVATDLSNQNNGASADIKLEKKSSAAFGVSEVWAKPTEAKKSVTNSASEAESTTSAAATLNGSLFSAGANTISTPLNNGSLGSSPFFSSSISSIPSTNSVSEVPSTVQSLAATPTSSSVFGKLPANTSNDSNSQSTSAPPHSSTSPFKFGESAAPFSASTVSASPFSASTVSASSDQISKETERENSTFGNINTFKFGDMASADAGSGNAFVAKSSEIKSTPGFMFGISSPAVADTGNNIFGGTSSVVGGSTLKSSTAASSAPESSGSSIFGVTSSSTPVREANNFSGSSAATTGSIVFGSSTPAFTSSGSSMFGGVAASTGSSVFGFNVGSSASSAASSQSQASNIFGASNAQTGNTGSGTTTSTQSVPFQFGASASAASIGMSGNVSLASNNSPFGFSKPEPSVFASGSSQQSMTNSSANSSSMTSWQAPNAASNSAPVFSSSFTPSSSPTFSFGAASAATGSSASTPTFGAATNTPSSSPIFSFSSTAPTTPQQPVFGNSAPSSSPSQSLFGNSTPGFAFGATNTNGINNNQQVSMEDSMAEDTDQANKTSVVSPMFGQAAVSMPQPNFGFGGGAATPPPSMANPFQFGGQTMAGTPQNASLFQASQSLEFQGGGSFSLGSTGGGDKTGRRIFKAKKTNRKK